MSAFLTGLNKRQAMLLLTAVTFGGQESLESFDQLPEDQADILRDRARQILAIPREKRVPYLVQEIKRFIAGRKAEELRAVDPDVVASALAKERPAMVEVILRGLPASIAAQVRKRLRAPATELKREVRGDVLGVIRWKLESRLAELLPRESSFSLSDLLVMPERDLSCVADFLGARALAPLVLQLGDEQRDEFLKKLPPDLRRETVQALEALPDLEDRPDPETAGQALEEALRGRELRQAVRVLGIRQIARACVAGSSEFASRFIEQHHDAFGRHLAIFVTEERQAGSPNAVACKRELIALLERLATDGVLERPVRLMPPSLSRPNPVGRAESVGSKTTATSPVGTRSNSNPGTPRPGASTSNPGTPRSGGSTSNSGSPRPNGSAPATTRANNNGEVRRSRSVWDSVPPSEKPRR